MSNSSQALMDLKTNTSRIEFNVLLLRQGSANALDGLVTEDRAVDADLMDAIMDFQWD
jgi:hypothetical protein